mmetsp:Transcript_13122/g.36990  ORF Transcript_13122/g.36990 Transcript_13122/m.36990 type:complete len:230 (-) Transcript_13122:145-834(-)
MCADGEDDGAVQRGRLEEHAAPWLARVWVVPLHCLPHVLQAHPVRGVLETSDIENEHRVQLLAVSSDGAVVPVAGLLELLAGVGDDQGLLVGRASSRRTHEAAEFFECPAPFEVLDNARAIALGEAEPFRHGDAGLLYLIERGAAVQHGLVVPAPRPLPNAPAVHLQGVEHHDQRGDAAVSGLVLRAVLLREAKVAHHVALCHGLHEDALALGRVERGERRRAGQASAE